MLTGMSLRSKLCKQQLFYIAYVTNLVNIGESIEKCEELIGNNTILV